MHKGNVRRPLYAHRVLVQGRGNACAGCASLQNPVGGFGNVVFRKGPTP